MCSLACAITDPTQATHEGQPSAARVTTSLGDEPPVEGWAG